MLFKASNEINYCYPESWNSLLCSMWLEVKPYFCNVTTTLVIVLHGAKISNFRCRGLVLLETYSAAYDQSALLESLPKFLTIEREVTGDPAFSMYNLSLKEDWKTSKRYYAGSDCNGEWKFLKILQLLIL